MTFFGQVMSITRLRLFRGLQLLNVVQNLPTRGRMSGRIFEVLVFKQFKKIISLDIIY